MRTKLLVAAIVGASLFACQGGDQNPDGTDVSTSVSIAEGGGTLQHMSLNRGERWPANSATTGGIQEMKELLRNFPGNADKGRYQALSTDLNSVFNSILKQCTMKGEAHDQLHNYLMPLKEMIDGIAVVSPDDGGKMASDLRAYLDQYEFYFY